MSLSKTIVLDIGNLFNNLYVHLQLILYLLSSNCNNRNVQSAQKDNVRYLLMNVFFSAYKYDRVISLTNSLFFSPIRAQNCWLSLFDNRSVGTFVSYYIHGLLKSLLMKFTDDLRTFAESMQIELYLYYKSTFYVNGFLTIQWLRNIHDDSLFLFMISVAAEL